MECCQQQVRPHTPDTDDRAQLAVLINRCAKCHDVFYGNVAMITTDDGYLTDEQVREVLVFMARDHEHLH
jgi:hypothetical protein